MKEEAIGIWDFISRKSKSAFALVSVEQYIPKVDLYGRRSVHAHVWAQIRNCAQTDYFGSSILRPNASEKYVLYGES